MKNTKTQAIADFLQKNTHQDLARLYNPGMEVQVNVARGQGEKIKGSTESGREWVGWTDGIEEWAPYRIPWNAWKDPHYEDKPQRWPLEKHAEAIGLTGWNWQEKRSRGVGFDFDSIAGHSKGLPAEELQRVQEAACSLPYVTVRKSTSGIGLHLYVFLGAGAPVVANHTEHAAIGRAILNKMSFDVAYDFEGSVDCFGGVLWVWSRKMKGRGLELVKAASEPITVPDNWREHIGVTSGRRKKVRPNFIKCGEEEEEFDLLSGRRERTKLDDQHRRLLLYLDENSCYHWFDCDHHMLVCHTSDLASAHEDLKLRGIFQTVSTGSEPNDQNCFAFPIAGGAWSVRRHGKGTQEAETWSQDGNNWTHCYLNHVPTLSAAVKLFGGIEGNPKQYTFPSMNALRQALAAAEVDIDLPDIECDSPTLIRKRDSVTVQLEGQEKIPGWVAAKKKNTWTRSTSYNETATCAADPELQEIVRHIVSDGVNAGWSVLEDGRWTDEPLQHVSLVVGANKSPGEAKATMKALVLQPWQIVCKPFEPEYPGDRQWNRQSAQFAYPPSLDSNLSYPTWIQILKHTGAGLNETIASDKWCQENGVSSGQDYLFLWVASMVQRPFVHLPYLYFYGPQGSGKSIFHESLELILTRGVERAEAALKNERGFNAELEGAVLCVIEEVDLSNKRTNIYNRIKDYVTASSISIHRKSYTPYMLPNPTHWVQCANSLGHVPSLDTDDSRLTIIHVSPLGQDDRIPQVEMFRLLRKEAPDFIAALLRAELPESSDPRLGIPCLTSREKQAAISLSRSHLEEYLEQSPITEQTAFKEFFAGFLNWLDPQEVSNWSKIKVSRELTQLGYQTHRGKGNVSMIGPKK